MDILTGIVFGVFVGLSMGMTGGGGSLLAVPLLMYGLMVPAREAITISLAAVGMTALVGVLPRIAQNRVEISTGLLFACAGILGAPLGTWVAAMISEGLLLALFSLLMLTMAWWMWSHSKKAVVEAALQDNAEPVCQRDESGRLQLTSRCAMMLAAAGIAIGFLSGMFGVGGGFVIVPALVFFSSMPIHRAVATSLLVIFLVSAAGVTSHWVAGREIPWLLTSLFVLGGIGGMWLGGKGAARLSPELLQKIFAGGLVVIALIIVGKTFL